MSFRDASIDFLLALIDEQFVANFDVNLLGSGRRAPRIAPSSIEAAVERRTEILGLLTGESATENRQRVAHHMAARMEELLSGVNPYIRLSEDDRSAMRRLYTRLIGALVTILRSELSVDGVSSAYLRLQHAHFARLRGFLGSIGDAALLEHLRGAQELKRVPAGEYSAHTQLAVLGLAVNDSSSAEIRPPVLDIGCGTRAALVGRLNALGLSAFGIDRYAPPGPGLTRADWLEFDYGRARWTTVVSHMAFTNHFRHHHLRRDGLWIRYAEVYTAILESLVQRGVFAYAPAVPFVEVHLPSEQYRFRRVPVQRGFAATQVVRLR